jgi:hypothetical protein
MRLHRATIELLDNQPGLLVRCVLPVRKQLTAGLASGADAGFRA